MKKVYKTVELYIYYTESVDVLSLSDASKGDLFSEDIFDPLV